MDVDNENFYEELASLLPQPGDYSLEDLDEIIRSTDSHLDASLDINSFEQNDFDMAIFESNILAEKKENHSQQLPESQRQHQQVQQLSVENEIQTNFGNDYNFNFSVYPSPPTSQKSELFGRTSSPTSIDGDNFNPDDFINFFNDYDTKVDELTADTIMKLNENCRNTPSPTDSCTSSCGSSTSGVQSDVSSEASISQIYSKNETSQEEREDDLHQAIKLYENSPCKVENQFDSGSMAVKENSVTTLSSFTVPVLPVVAIPSVQPLNFIRGTIIPVQTVPLTAINPVVKLETPTAIKIENKPTAKKTVVAPAGKQITSVDNSNAIASPKVSPPANAKPKTIFLSSNDFKALMQKMSANGKKITAANGQIPQVIMKTANGKVIAANKITNIPKSNTQASTVSSNISNSNNSVPTAASSHLNSQSQQQDLFVSKVAKASSGPMLVTQQPSKVVSSNARSMARATLSHTKSYRTDLNMLKGFNDDKLLKKQLRMLKNRESASLSRRKKKEYIEMLEHRISNLEKENYSLKRESSSLRSQLMAFAKTCNCKHRNVSEFILDTLNMDEKSGGAVLNLMNNAKQHLDNCEYAHSNNITSTHHVKIAPKPANADPFMNKGFKHRMNATSVKRNVAVLFAMAFMVTWTGNFQNFLNKSTLESAIDASVTGAIEDPAVQTGHRLLWVPNENEFNEQTNRTKRDTEMANMPPPPLHFLRPVNRTAANKMNGTSTKDEPPIKRLPATMATYANATQENMRLARNLHKWIGGNGYLNLTDTGIGNDLKRIDDHFKFGSGSYMDYDLPLQAPIGMKQKRKIILDSQEHKKHRKLNGEEEDHNSLGIFKPTISEEYLRLFKGIKRQDDTFYVLSFNMDHILLPASSYNKSSRPKVSLMLPAGYPSHNGDIVLMQIDCLVVNTTELEIKSHMIPEKLRPSPYTANVPVNPYEFANNKTSKPKDLPLKSTELKEKPPAPRTYFMMGPKTEKSQSPNYTTKGSNIMKRKPNIVKLNANDSVIGSGVLNVRNSSLFSRMRDSISSQTKGFIAPPNIRK